MIRIAAVLLLWGCLARELPAQTEIFLVRHAEKANAADGDPKDPALSPEGRARAESLARALRDANISVAYATEFKRTQQTADPTARAAGIGVTIVPAKETDALVSRLRESKGNALVVGHSNTLPELIRALGIDAPVAIADGDYDNLFVVIIHNKQARLLRLHY